MSHDFYTLQAECSCNILTVKYSVICMQYVRSVLSFNGPVATLAGRLIVFSYVLPRVINEVKVTGGFDIPFTPFLPASPSPPINGARYSFNLSRFSRRVKTLNDCTTYRPHNPWNRCYELYGDKTEDCRGRFVLRNWVNSLSNFHMKNMFEKMYFIFIICITIVIS